MRALQYKQWTIFNHNEEATKQIIEEVFIDKIYDFETDNPTPFIIDCGANVGVASLFFKEKYPHSEILCFEPDPNAFAALKKNVEYNQLSHMTLVNKALAADIGETNFYGHILNLEPDSRGNSILKAWGFRGDFSDSIKVPAIPLSINRYVDFLKIDIEGAEWLVVHTAINDIKKFVKQCIIECHVFNNMEYSWSYQNLLSLLIENNFDCNVRMQKIDGLFPAYLDNWKKKELPEIMVIYGLNKKNIIVDTEHDFT